MQAQRGQPAAARQQRQRPAGTGRWRQQGAGDETLNVSHADLRSSIHPCEAHQSKELSPRIRGDALQQHSAARSA